MSTIAPRAPLTSVPSRPVRAAPVSAGASRPARPPRHTTGLVGAMNVEWDGLVAGDQEPARRELLRGWATRHPALAGRAGVGALVEAVTRHGDDDVLKSLLLLARGGDELAARAAL